MNCKQATRLISDAQDRSLATGEKAGIGLHLMICVNCRRFNAQMSVLKKATGLLANASAPLPDEPIDPSSDQRDGGREGR